MFHHYLKPISAIVLILCLLLACGCGQAEPEETEPSFEIPAGPELQYVRFDYNIALDYLTDERYCLSRNLSGTNAMTQEHIYPGYRLIEFSEEYDRFMDVLEQQSEARQAGLTEVFRSEGLEIKRDFWAENQLLALDLCVFGALRQIKAEPVITKMENGGELVVDFYYGADISTTADNSGVLLLVVIPRSYSFASVDINWIRVEEWTEYGDPEWNGF